MTATILACEASCWCKLRASPKSQIFTLEQHQEVMRFNTSNISALGGGKTWRCAAEVVQGQALTSASKTMTMIMGMMMMMLTSNNIKSNKLLQEFSHNTHHGEDALDLILAITSGQVNTPLSITFIGDANRGWEWASPVLWSQASLLLSTPHQAKRREMSSAASAWQSEFSKMFDGFISLCSRWPYYKKQEQSVTFTCLRAANSSCIADRVAAIVHMLIQSRLGSILING